jgi:site-specific DNA recombinase
MHVRCAIYTRQSVARPGDPELASCKLQREICKHFIWKHRHDGWMPLELLFDDEGRSGSTMDRPALSILITAVEHGLVDRVVVHRLERLTRSAHDWAKIQNTFNERNVPISVVEGDIYGNSDAVTQLRLNTLAAFEEFEREIISERLREGRAARRARGLRTAGRVPLGYSSDPTTKQLVLKPDEAKVVRRLFEYARSGMTPDRIAERANTRRFKKQHGAEGTWCARDVLRLLRNPAYAGRLPNGSKAVHEAIVRDALFDDVVSQLEGRRTRKPSSKGHWARGSTNDRFMLRGLLVCPRCNHRLTTSARASLDVDPPRYYRCRRARCRGAQLPAKALEKFFVEWLACP